jgi:hypothetical protein
MPPPPCLQSPTMSDAGCTSFRIRSPSQVTARGGRSSALTSQSSRHWQVPDRRQDCPLCRTRMLVIASAPRGPARQPIAHLGLRRSGLRPSCLRHRCSDPLVARRDRQHGCGSRVRPSQPGKDNEMRSSRASMVHSMIFGRRLGARRAVERCRPLCLPQCA